jgi:hypothetical protein
MSAPPGSYGSGSGPRSEAPRSTRTSSAPSQGKDSRYWESCSTTLTTPHRWLRLCPPQTPPSPLGMREEGCMQQYPLMREGQPRLRSAGERSAAGSAAQPSRRRAARRGQLHAPRAPGQPWERCSPPHDAWSPRRRSRRSGALLEPDREGRDQSVISRSCPAGSGDSVNVRRAEPLEATPGARLERPGGHTPLRGTTSLSCAWDSGTGCDLGENVCDRLRTRAVSPNGAALGALCRC